MTVARFPIEEGGQLLAARDDQLVTNDGKITLRRQARLKSGAVVPVALRDAIAVGVRPDDFPRLGIQRVDEHALGGPETGGEVDHTISQHGSAASRPQRNQPPKPQHLAIPAAFGKPPELPTQRTGIGIETIQVTVVGDKVDFALPGDGREADRPTGDVPPPLSPRLRVQRRHTVGHHRRHEHRAAKHHGFVGSVVGQPDFVGERRARWRQRASPAKLKGGRQFVWRCRGAPRVVAELRPVAGPHRSRQRANNDCQRQWETPLHLCSPCTS
jgi:hypothetical protein